MRASTALGGLTAAAMVLATGVALAQQHFSPPSEMLRLEPRASFGLETGVAGWTHGMARATHPGPLWQARLGVELLPWLAVDAVYIGQYNGGVDAVVDTGVAVLSNGAYSDARFMLPFGCVRPYVLAGYGASWASVLRRDNQTAVLQSGGTMIVPVGFGVSYDVTRRWSLAVQTAYQFSVGAGTRAPASPSLGRGDTWNAGLAVNYALP